MNTTDGIVVMMEPWHARVYQALMRPITPRDALRTTAPIDDHRSQLDRDGDAMAAEGASAQLWIALLKLASVETADLRALCRKARALSEYRAIWAGEPLSAALVQAAIAADVAALATGRVDQARIERLLQGRAR